MKRIFLITAISCLVFSCNAKEKKNDNSNIVQKDSIAYTRIEKLKRAFKQKDYATFFKLFPDTYSELQEFYGFDDKTGKKPLYDLSYTHMNYFFEYEGKISSEVFAKKAYEVAKNGVWEADAVGFFQSDLSDLIIRKPNIFLEILTTKPDKETASFWFFIFDGSQKHNPANEEMFEAIYNKINSLDKKQGKLLKEEFERMYK